MSGLMMALILALAREMVEAHDGRIELSNRRRGGLEVALTIPA